MKHITYGDKSLLVGDQIADLLLEYAALLTRVGSGDTVTVSAISSDGDEVLASFLLGPGAPMMAETAHNHQPEPDNAEAVTLIENAMRKLSPSVAELDDGDTDADYAAELNS